MPGASPLPPPKLPQLSGPRRFTDLLRKGRFTFTERELMEHLKMTYRTIKQREADPSTLTVAEMLRVADLIDEPVEAVFATILAELRSSLAGEAQQ